MTTGPNECVRDWMKHPVHTVKPLDTAAHARELLERHRVNQLPVVVDGHLVGIVTDRDVRDAFPSVAEMASGTGQAPTMPVESIMSRTVVSVEPTTPLVEAARVIRRERIGALPVLDHGRLVGILTRSDVLDAFLAHEAGTRAA